MIQYVRTFSMVAVVLAVAGAAWSADATLAGHDIGQPGGLAVIAGSDADQHANELAQSGTWLVRVIAADEAEAKKFHAATEKLLPLVTVRVAAEDGTLPFAPQTVNLIVLGEGAKLPEAEIKRVIAPESVVLVASGGGKFKRDLSPKDERHAPWTHWQADEHATGVSADTAVAPSNALRWWSMTFISAQLRSGGGVAAYWEDPTGIPKKSRAELAKQARRIGVHGYDVYSGVPLWTHRNVMDRPHQGKTIYAAHELGFIHPQSGDLKPLVLTDARTGEIKVTYEAGVKMPKGVRQFRHPKTDNWTRELVPKGSMGPSPDRRGVNLHGGVMLVHGDTLIQVYGLEVVALDIPTGKKHWGIKLENPSARAIVSRDGSKIFVQEQDHISDYIRWGSFGTMALTALDMKTGKTIWRNDDWATMEHRVKGKKKKGPPNLSELIEYDGVLYAWDQASNIGSDHHGDLFAIDPDSGKIQWHLADANDKDPNKEYNKHGAMTNNLVIWDGRLFTKFAEYTAVDPAKAPARFKGRHVRGLDRDAARFLGGNQRCVRMAGAANFLVYGFTSFLAKDGTSYQTGLTRGNCAMPNYASYGAVLSVGDETCSCYNGVRGQVALIPPLPIEPIDDDARVTKPTARPVAATDAALPESPIVDDWEIFPSLRLFWEQQTLGPAQVGDVFLKIDIQRHLVSAFESAQADQPLWRYRADGRIYTLPTVHDGMAYLTTTAGTVTAIDLKTGKPAWRFLAAPQPDQVVVNGQLESRWPVYNSVIKDGTLYVAAGRHAEVDGGVWAWAIDAKTGEAKKGFRIFQPITVAKAGESDRNARTRFRGSREIASNSLLLGGVALNDDGQVCLIRRKWNKSGSRPSFRGYWRSLGKSAKVRWDRDLPDPARPNQSLHPVDFDKWDGKLLDMVTAIGLDEKLKRDYRSPFEN